jgi:hypothetical protein
MKVLGRRIVPARSGPLLVEGLHSFIASSVSSALAEANEVLVGPVKVEILRVLVE